MSDTQTGEESTRGRILNAAVVVFAQYGFRKASMDEVARRAELSRQGLYLHFPRKKDLFRETVVYAIGRNLQEVRSALAGEGGSEERLLGAFEVWHGQYAGAMDSSHAAELYEASALMGGGVVEKGEETFRCLVVGELKASGISKIHEGWGVSAPELASTLEATSKGLKYSSSSLEAFREGMRLALRIIYSPAKS